MNLFSQFFGSSSIKQLNAEQLKALLVPGNDQPYVLDVRQPEEYREGHIAGARLVPLGELPRRMKDLPHSREIVCVCHTGSRSSAASRQLSAAGYQVANLRGGMIAWERAGLPVKKGNG